MEKWILIEGLVVSVTALPDHLEVNVCGAHRLRVLYQEVGLKESVFDGVGGPRRSRAARLRRSGGPARVVPGLLAVEVVERDGQGVLVGLRGRIGWHPDQARQPGVLGG